VVFDHEVRRRGKGETAFLRARRRRRGERRLGDHEKCKGVMRKFLVASWESAPSSPIRHLLPALFRLPKTPNRYTLILEMATAMFAETLDKSQHSERLNPKSQSYIFFIIIRYVFLLECTRTMFRKMSCDNTRCKVICNLFHFVPFFRCSVY
jgi:hypothetical protein